MAKILLEMKNITKTFPGVKALDNVNLQQLNEHGRDNIGRSNTGNATDYENISGRQGS